MTTLNNELQIRQGTCTIGEHKSSMNDVSIYTVLLYLEYINHYVMLLCMLLYLEHINNCIILFFSACNTKSVTCTSKSQFTRNTFRGRR